MSRKRRVEVARSAKKTEIDRVRGLVSCERGRRCRVIAARAVPRGRDFDLVRRGLEWTDGNVQVRARLLVCMSGVAHTDLIPAARAATIRGDRPGLAKVVVLAIGGNSCPVVVNDVARRRCPGDLREEDGRDSIDFDRLGHSWTSGDRAVGTHSAAIVLREVLLLRRTFRLGVGTRRAVEVIDVQIPLLRTQRGLYTFRTQANRQLGLVAPVPLA